MNRRCSDREGCAAFERESQQSSVKEETEIRLVLWRLDGNDSLPLELGSCPGKTKKSRKK